MYHKTSILNWNLQSYKTKFNELKLLIQDIQPACICLQETLLKDYQANPPGGYSITQSRVTRDDNHERSVAILVHNRISFDPIQLNTHLQAVAGRIHLDKAYTICTIYLPHIPVTYNQIADLINQLPRPFIIIGDMNARNNLWGTSNGRTDPRGEIFERLLVNGDVCLLNDGFPTHYQIQTGTHSAIDLALCSPDCMLESA